MKDVRIAVVGAGGAAQILHLPILRRLTAVELVGLFDEDEAKARTIAERFEIPNAGRSLEALEATGDVDAVLVCTPTDTHEELVIAALESGAHVLCERPLATSSAAAARMVDTANATGRHLMVALNQRYRLDVRAIRQFVASGELGEIFFVRSVWRNPIGRRPRGGWRRDPQRSGGGVLMDLGVQALDAALWLLEYPTVERVTARFHGADPVEDTATALLALENGATIAVDVTWELMEPRDRNTLSVLGTAGSAETDPLRVFTELETGLVEVTPPLDAGSSVYTGAYRQEWAEFLRLVRGDPQEAVPDDQVRLLTLIEACYRSAREGRDVRVEAPGD